MFLQRYKAPIIIDEIQYAPNLLSYIKIAVDNSDEKGAILASRAGQMLNYTDIANKVGIAVNTIKSWVSILVSSNIFYLLQSYFYNLNKRIVKIPKVYFLDTGLCSYLSNWETPKTLESGTK